MVRAALCLLAILTLSSCNRMSRVRECQKLSSLVNPKLSQIEELAKKGRALDYKAATQSYGALAKDVKGYAPSAPELKALSDEYASVLESIVPAVSSYAVALEGQDKQGTDEARRSLERLSKHQRSLVQRIDAYCLAP